MSGLPQRVLDLFDQVVTKPRSSSASSSSSSDSGAAADTATSHTLPSSTRIVAFDNTAFPPPTKCTTMSDVPGFPSAVCVPATSVDSAPIPPRPQNATHLAEFVIAFLTSRSGDAGVFDDIAAGIITTLGIVPRGGAEEENVRHRLAMFLGWMKKGQWAVVVAQNSNSGSAAGGGERVVCGPSSGNGISSDLRWVGWPDDLKREKKEVVWKVLTAPGDERKFEMRTFFAGESGWTVVSDVDDTIKVSEVNNRIALLRNTFVAEPSPTNGMPPFYQAINAKLHPNWFYLSASPWQLYPFLHDFISSPSPSSAGQTLYPRGQLILRDMNRGAMPVYLSSLTMGTREYKFDRLEKIHAWLPEPNRRVLLIGDSTQTDPESYGDVARKWPTWVGAIWIRVVKGVDENKEKDLNDPKRFEKAFEGVDKSIWRTFEDPNTLADALAGLKV